MSGSSRRRTFAATPLRLLLTLLLALAPLLSLGQTPPGLPTTGDDGSARMPCHTIAHTEPAAPSSADRHDCPDCCGAASAAQCHCCGHTAPAGLTGPSEIDPGPILSGPESQSLRVAELPDSPPDGPYRPPILS